MLSGRTEKPTMIAEKRINRSPYPIYVRVVRVDTLEGIKYRFEISSNTVCQDLSVIYDDRESAMSDFRKAVRGYSCLKGSDTDDLGSL